MNLHVPQTEEGKAEAQQLMLVQNQIISPRYGAPVITFEEDGISGAFILTMEKTVLDKKEVMQYAYEMGKTELPAPDKGKKYSGKSLFSMALPEDLTSTPPDTEPAYYYRPFKTILVRTIADGGESFYIRGRHRDTMPALHKQIIARI